MLPLETPYYKLDILPGAEDLVLIFPGLTEAEGRYGYESAVAGLGASRLHYVNTRPEWASGGIPALVASIPAMLEELRALAAQSGARRIFSYGFSFGAFGALLYGMLLGAERILAVSGQTALGLPGTRSGRLLGNARLDSPLTDLRAVALAHPPKEAHLLYGERDAADLLAAIHMVGVPGVQLHFLRAAGHNLPGELHGRGFRQGLIGRTLSGRLDLEELGRLPIAYDAGLAEAVRQGFAAQERGDHVAAERAFVRLARALPDSSLARQQLGNALQGQGRWRQANAAYRAALALDAEDVETICGLVSTLRLAGLTEEALEHCGQGLRLSPSHRRLTRYWNRMVAEGRPERVAETVG
ncbi:hypothetical protein J8J14_12500 [Roseomonas sp. SSH11]|uniref:Tetratricopeptide repeat protein n=1 Tax=Pararoseomonas baculiformis TaxID=2820812 RepID=A0ABS4AEY1_9PROT|nr:hypothetical protein [Pararoseomonas baculiformis]MBP0445597.1 hypothetical protein [Pararoseomonas baculiformis]